MFCALLRDEEMIVSAFCLTKGYLFHRTLIADESLCIANVTRGYL